MKKMFYSEKLNKFYEEEQLEQLEAEEAEFDAAEKAKADAKDTIEGADVFKLYDTFGFPIEITEEKSRKGYRFFNVKIAEVDNE